MLGFSGGSVVKNLPANARDAGALGKQDPLEEKMAAHSSCLAWEIPWTEGPVGLYSTWSQRVRIWLRDSTHTTPWIKYLTFGSLYFLVHKLGRMVLHEGVLITKPTLCMLRGGVSPHLSQAMLQHHLGIGQLNPFPSILHCLPRHDIISKDWGPSPTRPSPDPCSTISDASSKPRLLTVFLINELQISEIPKTPSLGLIHLLKWLTEAFYLAGHWCIIKEYNSGTARWKRCLARDGAGESLHALSRRILPAPPYVRQPGKPFRFPWRFHYIVKID